jgi:hypothetical protein
MDTYPGDTPAASLDFACVHTHPDIEAERAHLISHESHAAKSSARTLEHCYDAVSRGVHDSAPGFALILSDLDRCIGIKVENPDRYRKKRSSRLT